MRKSWSALGLAHTGMRLRALTAITDITLMLALPTATTERIGSLVACSSVPARGFMDFADADSIATILAAGVSGAVALTVASVAGVLTDGEAVSLDVVDSIVAAVSPTARLAAGSEAALADSTGVGVSTGEAAFTAVAVPTGGDTGNCPEVCD
jgi:hypothetical protein